METNGDMRLAYELQHLSSPFVSISISCLYLTSSLASTTSIEMSIAETETRPPFQSFYNVPGSPTSTVRTSPTGGANSDS